MANRLKTNPIYFDQFDADAIFAAKGATLIIKKIRLLSAADGDILQLENEAGDVIFHIVQTGNADTVECDFGEGQVFNEGVQVDVSACTGIAGTDGTDAMWIYLK